MAYTDAVHELARRKDLCIWLVGRRDPSAYEALGAAQAEGRYAAKVLSLAEGKPYMVVVLDIADELARMREREATLS